MIGHAMQGGMVLGLEIAALIALAILIVRYAMSKNG